MDGTPLDPSVEQILRQEIDADFVATMRVDSIAAAQLRVNLCREIPRRFARK